MKKYTIKEFAKGKKAVKIENEEQWNKLNKVHCICDFKEDLSNIYYTNQDSWERQTYLSSTGWETLEFSQLDFEDEFVVGKWYMLSNGFKEGGFYINYSHKVDNRVFYTEKIVNTGYVKINDWADLGCKPILVEDLSEIQQFLPKGHVDLIKKDTFVLPGKWAIKPTESQLDLVWNFCGKSIGDKKEKNAYYHYLHFLSILGNPCAHSYKIKPDYTEITFEQFQQYVIKTKKEENMEKEIVGYKLIKPKYAKAACQIEGYLAFGEIIANGEVIRLDATHSDMNKAFQKIKEAGVLDLWFEPVYEEQFKTGDWVELRGGGNGMMPSDRIICQLLEIDESNKPSGHFYNASHFMFKRNGDYYRTHKSHIVRLATEEEIKTAQIQLPTIHGYQGKLENGFIVYGCARFSEEFFEDLAKVDYSGNRTIANVELSSGIKISMKEIKQIVDYINKNK
jgi:hypothetical protein